MGAGGPYLGQRVTVDGALRELAVIPSWAGVGRAPVDQVVASIRRRDDHLDVTRRTAWYYDDNTSLNLGSHISLAQCVVGTQCMCGISQLKKCQ